MFDYETFRFIWWVLVGVLLIGFTIADGLIRVWCPGTTYR